jgi:hypothetical protein
MLTEGIYALELQALSSICIVARVRLVGSAGKFAGG